MSNQVSFFEVTGKPVGQCTEEGCGWQKVDASVADCKTHVRKTGHSVVREVTTRASYFVTGQ